MGIKPATALKFALVASPFLILWTVLPWATLTVYGDFGGYGRTHIAGTNVTTVAPFGDGVAIILLALMSVLLSGVGLNSPGSRRVVGLGLILAGVFAAAIAVYNIVSMDTADLNPYSRAGYLSGGSSVDGTSIPYLIVANGLLVALLGLFVLSSPGERRALTVNTTTINIAASTQRALQTIMWSCIASSAVAFGPWFDAHTFRLLTSEAPVVMTALGDAVLFASASLACAFFASQMQRSPSELMWAGLAITGGIMFVFAGAEIAETAQGCASNGTILGLLGSFDWFNGCYSGTRDYEISAGTAVGWLALVASAVVAMLGLALPIIEAFARNNERMERSEQW